MREEKIIKNRHKNAEINKQKLLRQQQQQVFKVYFNFFLLQKQVENDFKVEEKNEKKKIATLFITTYVRI